MRGLKLIFNPITGEFNYIVEQPTKQEIIGSILLSRNEEFSSVHPEMGLVFDENSILYSDDNFTND